MQRSKNAIRVWFVIKSTVLILIVMALMILCLGNYLSRSAYEPVLRIRKYDLRQVFPDREALSDRVAFLVGDTLNIVIGERIQTIRVDKAYAVDWSPGGKEALIQIAHGGSSFLYDLAVLREPGWSQLEYIQRNVSQAGEDQADWSPNGNWIVFIGAPDYYTLKYDEFVSNHGMYILNQRTGEKRLILQGFWNSCYPEWSPDGRKIAVVINTEPEVSGLLILDLGENWEDDWTGPTGDQVVYRFSTTYRCSGTTANWFPDSRRLLVTDGLRILILNLENGTTETVYEITPQTAKGYLQARILPDGKHIIYQAQYRDVLCGKDLQCYHREIMLADLADLAWRDVTPKIEGLPPIDSGRVKYDWWQEQ